MSKDNLEKVKSVQVLEMIRLAYEFCTFTEDLAKQEVTAALSFYQKLMPLMYIKGALLPELEVVDESFNERYVTEEHWEKVFMTAREKFEKDDYFWVVDSNNDTLKASIAEHIADIYQDMKDFVILFQDNRLVAKENSVYELKKLFAIHWGVRISALMPVIHNLMYALEIKENEELEF
jgi:hypothetical protein